MLPDQHGGLDRVNSRVTSRTSTFGVKNTPARRMRGGRTLLARCSRWLGEPSSLLSLHGWTVTFCPRLSPGTRVDTCVHHADNKRHAAIESPRSWTSFQTTVTSSSLLSMHRLFFVDGDWYFFSLGSTRMWGVEKLRLGMWNGWFKGWWVLKIFLLCKKWNFFLDRRKGMQYHYENNIGSEFDLVILVVKVIYM